MKKNKEIWSEDCPISKSAINSLPMKSKDCNSKPIKYLERRSKQSNIKKFKKIKLERLNSLLGKGKTRKKSFWDFWNKCYKFWENVTNLKIFNLKKKKS